MANNGGQGRDCGGSEREEMRKWHLAPYCFALTVANCILPSFLGKVASIIRPAYGGPEIMLPSATMLGLAAPLWFYVFTVFSILASAALFIRKAPVFLMVHGILIVCIMEGIALFFFALSLCLPFIPIMEEIGQ
jgi:hypothetical protein